MAAPLIAGLRRFVSKVRARIDERVERAPDPEALTGRLSSRRYGLPVILRLANGSPNRHVSHADAGPSQSHADAAPSPWQPQSETVRPAADAVQRPDDTRLAHEALDRIRAEQHRRMRRGSFGRRTDLGG